MNTIGFILVVIFIGIPICIFLFKAAMLTFISAKYTIVEDKEQRPANLFITIFGIICIIGALAVLMFIF